MTLAVSMLRALDPAERERLTEARASAPALVTAPPCADVASGRVDADGAPASAPAGSSPVLGAPESFAAQGLRALAKRLRVTAAEGTLTADGVPLRTAERGTVLVVATPSGKVSLRIDGLTRVEVHDDRPARRAAAGALERTTLVRVVACDGQPDVVGWVVALRLTHFVIRLEERAITARRGYGSVDAMEEVTR